MTERQNANVVGGMRMAFLVLPTPVLHQILNILVDVLEARGDTSVQSFAVESPKDVN